MIEIVFAMMMIQNGDKVLEYVPTAGMADCLEQKRIVSRQIGEEQEGISVKTLENCEMSIDKMGVKHCERIINDS